VLSSAASGRWISEHNHCMGQSARANFLNCSWQRGPVEGQLALKFYGTALPHSQHMSEIKPNIWIPLPQYSAKLSIRSIGSHVPVDLRAQPLHGAVGARQFSELFVTAWASRGPAGAKDLRNSSTAFPTHARDQTEHIDPTLIVFSEAVDPQYWVSCSGGSRSATTA
jgi:hypothetical protein